MFPAAWIVRPWLRLLLMPTSETRAPSLLCSSMNLDARITWHHVSKRISILFTASWWSYLCLVTSLKTQVASVHSTSSSGPSLRVMAWGAIEYTSRSSLVIIITLMALWTVAVMLLLCLVLCVYLPFIGAYEMLRFNRIIQNCMLLIMLRPFWYRKCSASILACTFSKSLTNGKSDQ